MKKPDGKKAPVVGVPVRVPGGLSYKSVVRDQPETPAVKETPKAAPSPSKTTTQPMVDDRAKRVAALREKARPGAEVRHKKFGTGTISMIDEKGHLRVRFSEGEKNFVFPDAFLNGFLSF